MTATFPPGHPANDPMYDPTLYGPDETVPVWAPADDMPITDLASARAYIDTVTR